jgi:hypothetical protein
MDLSATGAKLKPNLPSAIPNDFVLVLTGDGPLRLGCRVTWRSDGSMDVCFVSR